MLYTDLQNNFSAGELSTKLRARSDLPVWKNGAETLVNFRHIVEGGITSRFGTDYKADLPGTQTDAVLYPFEFSDTQGYVLVLSNSRLDIYYDDGTVAVANITAPWSGSQIPEINVVRSGDTMFFVHEGFEPRVLVRTGSAAFTLSAYEFATNGASPAIKYCPFDKFAASDITVTPGATSGTGVSLTASAAAFVAGHVGLRMRVGGKQVLVTGYTSSTVLTITVIETLASTSATIDWDEEALSAVRGWPRAIAFHADRLAFGGTVSVPSGIWGSKTGEYFNFALGPLATDAIWTTIVGQNVPRIVHLASHGELHALCSTGEHYVPETAEAPFSASNNGFKSRSAYGADMKAKPQLHLNSLVYAQRFGVAIRQLENAERPGGEPLSILFSHRVTAPRSMAASGALRDCNEQYLFVCMEGGGLGLMHALPQAGALGWSWHETDGLFRSVAVVNGKVFFLVRRTINSVTKHYLEQANFSHALDCAKTVSVTAGAAAATGLSHLEGKSVAGICDGAYHGDGEIDSGAVEVPEPWSTTSATIGLKFTPTLKPMPVVVATQSGSTWGKRYRIVCVRIFIHETVRVVAEGQGLWILNVNDDMSQPPSPKTDSYEFRIKGWGVKQAITITNDVPLPVTILSVTQDVEF